VIHFKEFETKTGGRLDAIDITADVLEVVGSSGVASGSVLVFSPHTTCCVLVTSGGTDLTQSLERVMMTLAPGDDYYAHDDLDIRTENLVDDEPANAPAHIFHAFAGKASESIPLEGGRLLLGDGQKILFVELDSSRLRRYFIQVLGDG
jgi:secondary thiamine-phosphate synthase enzyme